MARTEQLNNPTQVVESYFEAFNRNDIETLVELFTEEATVQASSQNYEPVKPQPFYQKVFEMTDKKSVTIHSIAIDQHRPNLVIVSFDYEWLLVGGSKKHFTYAFDRFELDLTSHKIMSLVINLGPSVV